MTELEGLDLRNSRRKGRMALAVLSPGVDPANPHAEMLLAKSHQDPFRTLRDGLLDFIETRDRAVTKSAETVLPLLSRLIGRASGIVRAAMLEAGQGDLVESTPAETRLADALVAQMAARSAAEQEELAQKAADRAAAQTKARMREILKGITNMSDVEQLIVEIGKCQSITKAAGIPSFDGLTKAAERILDRAGALTARGEGTTHAQGYASFLKSTRLGSELFGIVNDPASWVAAHQAATPEQIAQGFADLAGQTGLAL
jgi:hypothetical protein